jgi:hypothetical protein
MQIKTASFTVTHRGEVFAVEMTSQDTYLNRRRAVVSVNDGEGKNVYYESLSGRQLMSLETAKYAIREGIKNRNRKRE